MNKMMLRLVIKNINYDQAKAFFRLFDTMEHLGEVGSTDSIKVFCDGDGAFRPVFEYLDTQEGDKKLNIAAQRTDANGMHDGYSVSFD